MKLSEKLLKKLVDDPPPGRHLVSVSDDGPLGWLAGMTVDRADVVGCVIWEMTLQCRAVDAWNADALTTRSQAIERSVTGLLEPLKLLEVDSLRSEALVRSEAPSLRGDDLHYYEVKLQPHNRITLQRFRASHEKGSKREQVPFTLTHDTIGKLVDDVTA
jgi:hypothetical protein